MKKIVYGVIATVFFSYTLNAQKKIKKENNIDKPPSESAYVKIIIENEETNYQFSSVRDFEEHSEQLIESVYALVKKEDEKNMIAIEMSLTTIVNGISYTITGKVLAPFMQIVEAAKKQRSQLLVVALG